MVVVGLAPVAREVHKSCVCRLTAVADFHLLGCSSMQEDRRSQRWRLSGTGGLN